MRFYIVCLINPWYIIDMSKQELMRTALDNACTRLAIAIARHSVAHTVNTIEPKGRTLYVKRTISQYTNGGSK
jgi:hypothetical protein